MSKQVRFRGETLQAVKTDPSLRSSAVLHKHRNGHVPHVGAKQMAKEMRRVLKGCPQVTQEDHDFVRSVVEQKAANA